MAKKKSTKKSLPVKVVIRKVIAVRKKSNTINDYINNVKSYSKSMGSSTWFPAGTFTIPLTTFNTHVGALDTAESSFSANPPTVTKEFRDDAKKLVESDVTSYLADVQKVANNNPVNAATIIKSADFDIKGSTAKEKNVGPENTDTSGTIIITATESGYHEWGQSPDGVNWGAILLRATSNDKKTVTGLTSGSKWIFRSSPILKSKTGEEGPWTVYPIFTVT
jgi:hypothetical protein